MLKKDKKIAEIINWLSNELKSSFDLVEKTLNIERKQGQLLYVKTVVDGLQLQEVIIKPFFELPSEKHVEAYLTSLPQQQEVISKEQILLELTKGSIVIVIQGSLFLLDIKKVHTNAVLETSMEQTLRGPQLSLSEDIETNINLIRQRYHQPSLTVEMLEVGEKSKQSLAVLYDQDTVNKAVLANITKKLQSLEVPIIQSSVELQRYMNDKRHSLFPTMMVTERTDRIIYNLAGGKVAILLDGNAFMVIAPVVFFDFMTTTEDKFNSYWVTMFTKLLRYFGLIVCLILPGLYVALISYNPEVLRVELTLAVAGSRIGVPYPSFIEVLFMIVFMELLTEASIRLPKPVSATATTVGGLILGTAATDAALTSNIMIIIVSAVAIATFVIPINELSFAVRVIRLVLLFFSTIFGLAGLTLATLGLIMYLSNLNSFGEPYLKLFFQKGKSEVKGVKP
ncbi:spore germination protein [Lederbergia lenta]|uniref:spore germination protein n=1 Tax=Lederbergia lenta TaxID=1467 RepID=UPI00203F5D70|nr:spore germination protein [Lederbergia lenta]MCM3112581.1 spore germination protein [Lederbergia lenta]